MNVSLTKKMEQWVRSQVKSGRFETASEVIRTLIRDAQWRESWRGDVASLVKEGLDDLEQGRYVEYRHGDIERFKRDIRSTRKRRANRRGAA